MSTVFATYLLFCLPPIAIALFIRFYLKKTITWLETGAQILICAIVIGIVFAAGQVNQTHDVEVWNGEITKKSQVEVHCYHSYQCMCTTHCSGSGSSRSCFTICQTCYEHNKDWYWRVWHSLGSYFDIHNVDRRGIKEPPRFTQVRIGEPYSAEHSYTNYIKAVPESLFNHDNVRLEHFDNMIPEYPKVYDYYRIDRVLPVGVKINKKEWSKYLSEKIKDLKLGVKKEANVNIVLVNTPDQTYRYALEKAWTGGKKNDIIVVIGATKYPKIDWVDTITLGNNAGNSLMTVLMRDRIMALEEVSMQNVIDTVTSTVLEKFDRKSMDDYEYLKEDIHPPMWVYITALILGFIASGVCTYFFHNNYSRNYWR